VLLSWTNRQSMYKLDNKGSADLIIVLSSHESDVPALALNHAFTPRITMSISGIRIRQHGGGQERAHDID
jgi:hypothetical protein